MMVMPTMLTNYEKSDYLKTLTAGNHIIRINFTDGYAEVTATITQNEAPQQAGATAKTGDNTQMAGTIFLGMAAVIVLLD